MRIENDDVWENVKQGKYLGFSIEGIFTEQEQLSAQDVEAMEKIDELLDEYQDSINNA